MMGAANRVCWNSWSWFINRFGPNVGPDCCGFPCASGVGVRLINLIDPARARMTKLHPEQYRMKSSADGTVNHLTVAERYAAIVVFQPT
jgi:hypothetical protein